jgi:hypothetical protein
MAFPAGRREHLKMRRRLAFTLLGMLVLVVAAVWAGSRPLLQWVFARYVTSQSARSASLPPVAAPGVRLPFSLVVRHIMLPVSVNGSRPLSFILDSGNRWACIDLARARSLRLALGGEFAVGGVGSQTRPGAFVRDAAFSIPGFPGFSQPVRLAIPMGKVASRLGQDCDGILGTEFIERFVVELDYRARTVTLHDRDTFRYRGPGESIPIRLDSNGHPVFEAEVTPVGGGPIRGRFLLDVGAGGSLVLYRPFVVAHHLPGPTLPTIRRLGGAGIGGESLGRLGRVARFRIGTLSLESPVASFSEDLAGAYASSAIQGSIGAQIASRFRLFLDYGRRRIILEPAPDFARPFDGVSAGVSLEAGDADRHAFRVREVLEGSPGSEAGLRKDDVITAIDGRSAADLTLSAIIDLFERPVAYRVTVRRGGQALTVTLTPRRLV